MTDIFDKAQEMQLAEMEAVQIFSLDRARRAAAVAAAPQVAIACGDCGTPIDPRRVRAQPGCTRCVECQGRSEAQASHRR